MPPCSAPTPRRDPVRLRGRQRRGPNRTAGSRRRRGVEFVTAVSHGTSVAPATPEAFADWVRPHLLAMARLAARLAPTGDRDDIVQEALARAWQKRGQFDARRGAPGAWLLAITADRARQARRRRPEACLPAEVGGRVRSTVDQPGDERNRRIGHGDARGGDRAQPRLLEPHRDIPGHLVDDRGRRQRRLTSHRRYRRIGSGSLIRPRRRAAESPARRRHRPRTIQPNAPMAPSATAPFVGAANAPPTVAPLEAAWKPRGGPYHPKTCLL
jgi:hypothetical protein